mmetsp:Transcript_53357/g.148389  ORF Transcript_53357/g.148389 Transcript_53357/m.148389 type:complete len:261 (+) Transcript_53357:957-1739(+)
MQRFFKVNGLGIVGPGPLLQGRGGDAEAPEVLQVLAYGADPGLRAEEDGRHHPNHGRTNQHDHGDRRFRYVLGQELVNGVQGENLDAGVIMAFPEQQVRPLPSVVRVRRGPASRNVVGVAGGHCGCHRRRHRLVQEHEQGNRAGNGGQKPRHAFHQPILQCELHEPREHGDDAKRNDPFDGQFRIELAHVVQLFRRQCQQQKEDDVGGHGHVHQHVVQVEGHRGEVERETARDVLIPGQNRQIARTHHGHVAATHLREKF